MAKRAREKEKLISLAQSCHWIVYQERLCEKEAVLKQKVQLRNEAIAVARKKAEEADELVNHLKLEPVIITLKDLNTRVSDIRVLSIPMSLKSAEIKSLVKKQVQVHSFIFKQGVTIFFTSNGTTKSEINSFTNCLKLLRKI